MLAFSNIGLRSGQDINLLVTGSASKFCRWLSALPSFARCSDANLSLILYPRGFGKLVARTDQALTSISSHTIAPNVPTAARGRDGGLTASKRGGAVRHCGSSCEWPSW